MGMSKEFAELWADRANIGIIIAAVLGVISTTLAIWTGNVKEDFLKRDLADANTRAEEGKAEASRASEEAAKLTKEAEEARLETERLKKQLAWRDVTSKQAEALRMALQKTPIEVTVFWIAGDAEGSAFARRLAEVLLSAGSKISAFAPMGMLGQEKHGLSISGSEREECELLASALRAIGFGAVPVDINHRKPDGTKYFTNIFVGYRDPPSFPLDRVEPSPAAVAP